MLLNTTRTVILATLALSFGMVQAGTDDNQRDIPATTHQVQSLNLHSGTESNPGYQFSRQGADYAAVMPVTHHQANVLKLQNVTAKGRDAQPS